MPPAGFQLSVPKNERSQVDALDLAATGIVGKVISKKNVAEFGTESSLQEYVKLW
jgi:hypothetical protein